MRQVTRAGNDDIWEFLVGEPMPTGVRVAYAALGSRGVTG
jgi:hypothetical protein